MKRLLRMIGRHLLFAVRGIIKYLPYPVYRVFAMVLIGIGRLVMFQKREIALRNLRFAFGRTKSDKEIRAIAQKYFKNYGRGMIDNIYMADRPELVDQNVRICGQEHLDEALTQGNGVILTGGHFGDFLLMYYKLVRAGYPVNVIMRRVRDEAFEDFISGMRDKRGIKAIYDLPAKTCVIQSLKALRNNEVLVILLDQNFGGAGRVFVDFFGRQAATASGPVVFSRRTKSPILPIFCLKDKGVMRHKVIIESPLEMATGGSDEENLRQTVARITKRIEDYARSYPEQWGGWIHKRWKSKPAREQEIIDNLKGKNDKKSQAAMSA